MSTATASPRTDVVKDEADQRRDLADWLKTVAMASDPVHRDSAHQRLTRVYRSPLGDSPERRALGLTSGVAGGYLMPVDFVKAVLAVAAETAIVRPRAVVVPMNSVDADVPLLDATTAPTAGSPAYHGGMVAQWSVDAASSPTADPSFKSARLTANALQGYVEVSRSLLSNSPSLAAGLLTRLFGENVGYLEDLAFLKGDGVGKPLGVQVSPALLTTAARAGATTITYADALLCGKKLIPSSRPRAVWLASQLAEDEVLGMTSTAESVFARSTTVVDPATGRARLFLGRNELLASEKLPALDSAGDFGLYDFSKYIIGDCLSVEVAFSIDHKFRENKACYRLVHWVAGLPWLDGAVTLADASTQTSAFVVLGTV